MKIVHKLLTAKCFKRLGRPWKQFYTDSCGKKAKQAALPPTTAVSLARYVRVRVRAKVGVGVKDICHVICVVQETTCVLMCEWVEKRMSLSISSDQSRSRSESRTRGRSAASAASSLLEFLAWAFGFLALTLCLLLVSQVCTAAMHAFFCGSYWGRSLWVPVPALSLHKLTISGNKCFRLFMAAIEDQPHTPDKHTHSHTHLLQCELTRDYSSRGSSLWPCLLSLSVLAVFSFFRACCV